MSIKKILVAAAAVALAATLSACGSNSAKEAATTPGKSAGNTFTIGFDASFPPYGYKDEATGEYAGFDLELAAEVAKRNNWKLKKQPIDWASKDMELDSGTIDCIWNGFTINGREDKYTWSKPYVDNSIVFVTKAGSAIKSQDDLAGKTVIVQSDSSGLSALQDEANKALTSSFAELVEVPDYNNGFMNLESSDADTTAVAVDLGVAKYQLEQRGADKFTILEPAFSSEQYGVGFKLGNEALRDQVQASLDEMKQDGTFMKLAKKYSLENAVIAE